MALTLAIKVGLSEMKPNTPTLAITTGLNSCSPGPIRRYHYPINIAVQRCAALLDEAATRQKRLGFMVNRCSVLNA